MRRVLVLLSQALLAAVPALAQQDLTGEYVSMFHEDQPERIPGPALGDYLGLPISDAARAYAEAWDASRMTLKEHSAWYTLRLIFFAVPGRCVSGRRRIRRHRNSEPSRFITARIN